MKIQSEFEDFYDWCAYMCSEDVFYLRSLNYYRGVLPVKGTESLKDIIERYIPRPDDSISWETGTRIVNKEFFPSFALVGDMYVPFLTYWKRDVGFSFHYDLESVNEILEERGPSWCFENIWKKKVKNFMTNPNPDLVRNIREQNQTPVIVYSGYCDNIKLDQTRVDFKDEIHQSKAMSRGLNYNGILKRVDFHKHYDAHTIIQEIEMYINKINNKEDDVQFEDKQKILSHGFDTKKSFRKRT